MISIDELTRQAVEDCIKDFSASKQVLSTEIMRHEIYNRITSFVDRENLARGKGRKLKLPDKLPNYAVARLISFTEVVKIINMAPFARNKYNDLYIYNKESGLYDICNKDNCEHLLAKALQFRSMITSRDLGEILNYLRVFSETVTETCDPDRVLVANGIYNFKTKCLEAFKPEYIADTKIATAYNPNATNVIIKDDVHGDWNLESWIQSLSDDPEIIELLWQIIAAVTRTNVRWNKALFFYSSKGNNGKGTFCEFLKNLVGKYNVAAIPIDAFSKNFMLTDMVGTVCIIADEVNVSSFSDDVSEFKAIVTADPVIVNRKNIAPISISYKGLVIQCVNAFPRTTDRTESFYRRQLFVPFLKSFKDVENKSIKEDYLKRPEVLEYALKKTLEMPYFDSFKEPEACKALLQDYKTENDPIREFLEDVLPQLTWDLLPYEMLVDLYQKWYAKNVPNGKLPRPRTIRRSITDIMTADYFDQWECREDPITVGHLMDGRMDILKEYGLDHKWYMRCATTQRGIKRIKG